ncbi:hypothetical protein CEXT_328991 [Caerostris extrusa]|uniref:Ribosomal protein S10 n=1 Tax=Caerostris extrusa TaxID=172846 RepID=A0AAV4QUB0_CAEEX|nr:hypothetical protein CEXT_328991 [Caerostris extrusa]
MAFLQKGFQQALFSRAKSLHKDKHIYSQSGCAREGRDTAIPLTISLTSLPPGGSKRQLQNPGCKTYIRTTSTATQFHGSVSCQSNHKPRKLSTESIRKLWVSIFRTHPQARDAIRYMEGGGVQQAPLVAASLTQGKSLIYSHSGLCPVWEDRDTAIPLTISLTSLPPWEFQKTVAELRAPPLGVGLWLQPTSRVAK